MTAQIGNKAPNLAVSEWVRGRPTNIDKEGGNVVLVASHMGYRRQ